MKEKTKLSSNPDYIIVFSFDRSGVIPFSIGAFGYACTFIQFLLCFTVINTGYLYNISINDKFDGNYFMFAVILFGVLL